MSGIRRRSPDHELDSGVVEAFGHVEARLFAERRFNAVLVAAAQFDACEASGLAILDKCGQVPLRAHMYVTRPSCMVKHPEAMGCQLSAVSFRLADCPSKQTKLKADG